MGGVPYQYFVPYDRSAKRALEALRKREFEAGRYSLGIGEIGPQTPAVPRRIAHKSIADAVRDGDASGAGTRSILDIDRVGTEQEPGTAAPWTQERLVEVFATDAPTRAEIAAYSNIAFESLERGECVYVVVYKNGEPDELWFAGYSYD